MAVKWSKDVDQKREAATATNDHTRLGKVAGELQREYPTGVWASKAIPGLSTESKNEVA